MKILILEFSLVVFLALGFGCQKEEWEIIELNNNVCKGLTSVDYTFFDYSGVVDTLSDDNSAFIIKGVEPGFIEDEIFWPCNLPAEYNQAGLEITFSGDVLITNGWTPGTPQPDYTGTPVVIIKAKIKVSGK